MTERYLGSTWTATRWAARWANSSLSRRPDILVGLGHDPGRVKTERFGPSGG